MLKGMAVAAMVALAAGAAQAQEQDDPSFITFSAGGFDVFDDHTAPEFLLQYRSDYKLWFLKPHAGVMANTDGAVYGFAGLLVDIYFGSRLVLTPSTAVGAYHRGDSKDLGHAIEFRSGAELAYRFDDRSRLGLGVYHMSNASLGDSNPGAESVVLTYSMPLGRLLGN